VRRKERKKRDRFVFFRSSNRGRGGKGENNDKSFCGSENR